MCYLQTHKKLQENGSKRYISQKLPEPRGMSMSLSIYKLPNLPRIYLL